MGEAGFIDRRGVGDAVGEGERLVGYGGRVGVSEMRDRSKSSLSALLLLGGGVLENMDLLL